MALGTLQLAVIIIQFRSAARTPPPMITRYCRAGLVSYIFRSIIGARLGIIRHWKEVEAIVSYCLKVFGWGDILFLKILSFVPWGILPIKKFCFNCMLLPLSRTRDF